MRLTTHLAAVVLLCAPLSAAVAQGKPPAQDTTGAALPSYRLRLMGVYDDRSGEPVEGVDVVDVMNGLSMKTTSTGTVALAFLPDGGALIRIRKIGYEPQTMMVSITPADTLPLTVILKKVTELAAVNIVDSAPRYSSPGLRGFEDRRAHAPSGYYVPEAVVRKDENRSIGSFLLAHIPNIHVREARGGQTFLDRSPRCGAGGPPAVYLDNVLLNGGQTQVNLGEIKLAEIAAVEYYANTATAPPEFNRTASSCGALVLWSREK